MSTSRSVPETAAERRAPSASSVSRRRRPFWVWVVPLVAFLVGGYFWLTTAKILREPVQMHQGPLDPMFAETLGPLLGAEFLGGNKVKVLVNGDQFFPEMLAAIRSARRTITLETYIWSSGEISDLFIEALNERAKAGVKVHVIADGMGTLKLKQEDRERLRSAGVELLKYGREHWYEIKPNINHRTHRKILVIDGGVGFTGGMCIDDKWLGNAESPKVWRETQIKIEGPAVRQLQAVFATNWLQTTGKLLIGPDYFPNVSPDGPSRVQCYKSGPNEDPENARISYLLAIAAARKSIRISHAYFVPDDLAIDMLVQARQRGVDVEVIVPAINDSRFGRAASRSRWGRLLEAGVRFYQYQPAMYHCKVMLVDDAFLTLGSVNFDNRSFAINDEVNVNVIDREGVQQALRSFEADRRASKPLLREEFEDRSVVQKWVDAFCGVFRSQL